MDLLEAIKSASEQRGLILNTRKTRVMIVDAGRNNTDANFSLEGDLIEEVESFEFLGSIINTKSDCTKEIKRRLTIARGVVSNLTKLWKSKLPPSLKVRLLKSTAFAVASYGSESWTMKLSDKKRYLLNCGAINES
ncbi:uncharacterized protein [Amphiura filiformis]|uniref:uncharacterized protein n=1 Tax=Amphiura filiformis TaxID=82378 RepID=UPI003B2247D2